MLFLSPEQFKKVEFSHYCTKPFNSYDALTLLIAQYIYRKRVTSLLHSTHGIKLA
jgi:hypothetical protein